MRQQMKLSLWQALGLLLESLWCVWTQFQMPKRGSDPLVEDAALRARAEDDPRGRAEADAYNRRVSGEGVEDDVWDHAVAIDAVAIG